jgi:hypothetical protein
MEISFESAVEKRWFKQCKIKDQPTPKNRKRKANSTNFPESSSIFGSESTIYFPFWNVQENLNQFLIRILLKTEK